MTDAERARKIMADWCDKYVPGNSQEALSDVFAAALAAERERCARVCERLGSQIDGTMDQHRDHFWQQSVRDKIGMADKCAAAIRALGDSDD